MQHTRLAIVDLSEAGSQPMENEDGSLLLSFNGEIYNSKELRRECERAGHRFRSSMDGEVILHLYEEHGPESFARLNGIFAFALANTATGEVMLARDPLGVKPLFYCVGGDGGLRFASEIRALASLGADLGSPDVAALAQFLSFLWIPDPRTPYAAVRSLLPGHVLRWVPTAAPKLEPFGEPLIPFPAAGELNPTEVVLAGRKALEGAVQRQLMADVPIGLMASGGIDSGLIWWACRETVGRAFTIEWPESGPEGLSEDAAAVRQLQVRFGTLVEYLPGIDARGESLPASGDLFADPAYDLTRLIARSASDHGYKVLLSGQGGDELFAGYRRHRLASLLGRLRLGALPALGNRFLRRLSSSRVGVEYAARLLRAAQQRDFFRSYMELCTYSTAPERARALGCTEAEVSDEVVWSRHYEVYNRLPLGLSYLRQAMSLDLNVYLPGLGLAYVDRGAMEYGVEVRVPWLDLELVRWSLTLPDNFLIRRRTDKWLPRQIAAEILGPELAGRPKRGFAAPVTELPSPDVAPGELGFRQGVYFGRAKRMLDSFLVTAG